MGQAVGTDNGIIFGDILLITLFPKHYSKMYYCNMEAIQTKTRHNQVILGNDKQYSFTVNPFEITNALGTAVATLQEYTITSGNGEIYKIYKTKEGNWYDMAVVNSSRHNLLLVSLKSAIDLKERGTQPLF